MLVKSTKLDFSKFDSWSLYVSTTELKSLTLDPGFESLSFILCLCFERVSISSILISLRYVNSTSRLLCALVTCSCVDISAKMRIVPLLAVFFVTVYAVHGTLIPFAHFICFIYLMKVSKDQEVFDIPHIHNN